MWVLNEDALKQSPASNRFTGDTENGIISPIHSEGFTFTEVLIFFPIFLFFFCMFFQRFWHFC